MTPKEFYDWPLDRVRDGGKSSLREVATFARNQSDLDLKGPAMAALLCWKEAGIEAIVEISRDNPTSKTLSSAYKLLSVTASGSPYEPVLFFMHNGRLAELVGDIVRRGDLRQFARTHLADLLQSLDNFDLLIPLGVAFTQMGALSDSSAPELIRALSSRWLRIGPSVVRELSNLIVEHPSKEAVFQNFLCKHPQILDPISKQVWSRPDFHGVLEPDFVIRRADNSYLVVEIETPAKSIATQTGQLTADTTHAEKQATDYRRFLDERLIEARSFFPNYSNADCLIVIGLEARLSDDQRASLANANAIRHKVRIVGFDWLAERAATIIENISAGDIEVIEKHRVI